jgi:hypothetical protein
MGTDFIKVEFRKHVKVSEDLGTTGPVCPFLQKQKMKTTTGRLFATLYNW